MTWIGRCVAVGVVSVLAGTLRMGSQTMDIRQLPGDVLVRQLATEDETVSDIAARELFRRGEEALPWLMGCRGNPQPYFGRPLGNPRGSTVTPAPGQPGVAASRVLTVEAICLYLISAIYRNDLGFAQGPYLADLRVDEDHRRPGNPPALVHRAWESTGEWFGRWKREGLSSLRSKRDDPLKAGGVAFW
jgi:hypothetical protein